MYTAPFEEKSMKNLVFPILAVIVFLFFAIAPAKADNYTIDTQHTTVLFFISHLGFSDMVGSFRELDGKFNLNETDPEKSAVDVVIKTASVQTPSKDLDEKLRGQDFFNSNKFPDIHFISTAVKKTGDNTADISGDLTMLGMTKPFVLHAKLNKMGLAPIIGHYIAGFEANGQLSRKDFGMDTYESMGVGDEVRLFVSVEGINEDKKAEAPKKH
jgi:polyisoprenoid-binding protein YceI